ncbi:lipopolysaccharide biosynthesis protein [Dyadobacter sandarakinus]|uniref:Oligosaccharide flippase family protein n=1 Tax=Dyadobacter sandarakinus TaxID=2747268 RepID=A0ABX7I0P8_9BACT|nr:oligosaccharide flippase family protein [Dyadobacter sandarakinus]QRQ99573.1 oligosaccharide flippase family protein [Dyadobacter sandarakinus]
MAAALLQKLRNKHFLSLAGNGIMSVLGMLNMIILYRALPVASIGMWVFFLSILLLVDTFRSGFLTTAFIKFYAGATEERKAEVTGSAWFIGGAITGILVLLNIPAFLFSSYFTNPSMVLFVEWFGIIYVSSLPYFIASCVVQAEQRFDQLLCIRFLSQGFFIIFVGFMALTRTATLQHILYAYLGGAAMTSIFTIAIGWARLPFFRKRSRACIAEIFHFGKYSVGTTLSSNLFGTSNTMIINFMLGPAALAVYNLGQRLMELIEIPLRSFAATGMPELSAAYNEGNRRKVIATMQRYTGLITIAFVPVCLVAIVLADVAIGIIGGAKYVHTEAPNIMRLFMAFALLYPLDRFFALTLDVIHQPQINFVKVLVMLAGSVGASFLGIYLTGSIYGVAVAGIVPVLIGVGVGYWGLNRFEPFGIFSVIATGYTEALQLIRSLWFKWAVKRKTDSGVSIK